MKKYILLTLCILILFSIPCFGADVKITELTEDTAPTSDDLVLTVNDPGTSPANRKSTLGNLLGANLTSLRGLTFVDASIIQLTGAGAAAVLTSGGNNYLLGSNSDNSALEFKSSIALNTTGSAATLSDGDKGDFTCTTGTCTVDNGAISNAKLANSSTTVNSQTCVLGSSCTIPVPTAASLHVDDLITLLGVAEGATNLGAFTGSTIADNQTAKAALQALETAVEGKVGTSSAASYTEPGSNIPLCRTGSGTIGGCTNVTDVVFSGYAALSGTNAFTGANTIGDGGDDIRVVARVNSSNGTWSGNTLYFAQCAASLAFGTPVYIQSTGKPAAADADAAATMPAIGLIVVASTDADTPCTVLTHGTITNTAWNWGTVGGYVYASETAGATPEETIGNISDTNDVVQVLGIVLHADTLFINPSLTTIVLE